MSFICLQTHKSVIYCKCKHITLTHLCYPRLQKMLHSTQKSADVHFFVEDWRHLSITNKCREGREMNRLSKRSMDLSRWTLHHSLALVAECLQNTGTLKGLSDCYEPPDKQRQKTHVKDPWRTAAYSVTELNIMTS